jgi:hypothetical protein
MKNSFLPLCTSFLESLMTFKLIRVKDFFHSAGSKHIKEHLIFNIKFIIPCSKRKFIVDVLLYRYFFYPTQSMK